MAPVAVAVADLNGDGKPELALANPQTSGAVTVLRNIMGSPWPVLDVEPRLGDRLSLGAWPNPASSGIHIAFTLSRSATVRLDVFDTRGRRIQTIVDGLRSAGAHSMAWEPGSARGPRVSPGVYFLALQAGGERATRRVVVIE